MAILPALLTCVASVSLCVLQLPKSLSYLLDDSGRTRSELEPQNSVAFFLDKSNVLEIHGILSQAAAAPIRTAAPAFLSWGILLYIIREVGLIAKDARENNQLQKGPGLLGVPGLSRRDSSSSIGSSQQSIYEEIFEMVRHSPGPDDDPVAILITSAVQRDLVFEEVSEVSAIDGSVHLAITTEKRLTFLELLSGSFNVLEYTDAVVLCLLELLDEGRPAQHAIASVFSRDKTLMGAVFEESLSRFPYESAPFLKLAAALSPVLDATGVPFILSILRDMKTFTQANNPNFSGYHTIREDENANLVSLDQPLSMHKHFELLLTDNTFGHPRLSDSSDDFSIDVGTTGQVISDSRPAVVMWYHHYSGVRFLGRMLHLIKRGEDVSFAYNDDATASLVAAAITLLSRLISACLGRRDGVVSASATEEAISILDEAGDSLERNEDIISLIFAICEQELESLRYRSAGERNLDVLIACMGFFQATISLRSGRVWPLLARSSLLDADGRGGLHGSVMALIEASPGYDLFLKSCVELFLSSVDEAVALPAAYNGLELATRASTRNAPSPTTPLHVVGKALFGMTQVIVAIFDSSTELKFTATQQQAEINAQICTALSKIVQFAYFVDDIPDLSKKMNSTLSPSAPALIETLQTESLMGSLTNPLLRILAGGCQLPDPALSLTTYEANVDQVENCLRLCTDAIHAGRSIAQPLVGLETQILSALPVLPRLVSEHGRFVTPALRLMDSLLNTNPLEGSPTSSLLSRLGSESSKNFLMVLGRYDHLDEDLEISCAFWQLLSTLVSSRQQWFAVFILTGSSPKESIRAREHDSERTDSGSKSFLNSALHALYQIEDLEPKISLVLLRFVAGAIENWSWATSSVRNQSGILPSLYNYVSKIDLKSDRPQEQCYQIKIAATIADILTIYFHHMRSSGDTAFLNKAIGSIIWYTQHASDVSAYKESLHYNLSQNLKRKYPGCQLSNFKRTSAAPRELGEDFYYDVDIAKTVLRNDTRWLGDRRNGFEHELRLANVNLSMVEAQLSLLKSWRTLAVEHSALILQNEELQGPMVVAASKCLRANTITYPQEAIFDEIFQTRADLALALLQRLNVAKVSGPEAEALLVKAWDAMHFRETGFDGALANNGLTYWRTLVEILFLALQFHCPGDSPKDDLRPPSRTSTTLPIVLEILTIVVAQSFRGMTRTLHDEQATPETVSPKDFGLVLGILQTCLRIPSLPRITAEISEHIISTDMAKYAILLYSWSHTLTPKSTTPNSEPDPVYGEISLLFLVSLSKIPLLAEDLATSSVLSQLSSTHVTQLLTRPHPVSPFDTKSVLSRRLYSIWTSGVLPLCLNLLAHIGRNFASEIAAFLRQFPTQLQRAALSFASTSTNPISLSMTHEVSNLALIAFILDAYRAAGPSAGVDALDIPDLPFWDEKGRKEVREDLEYLVDRRAVLRRRITPMSSKESEMVRAKPTRDCGYESLLEQSVVEEVRGVITCLRGRDDV